MCLNEPESYAMNPSRAKHSESKLVPHSDFQAGITSEESCKVLKNRDTYIGTWNVKTLYSGGGIRDTKSGIR